MKQISRSAVLGNSVIAASLTRLAKGADNDIDVARIVLGLFESIFGTSRLALFPGYSWSPRDIAGLPKPYRADALALLQWMITATEIDLGSLLDARTTVVTSILRIRGESALGQRLQKRAATLRRAYPALPSAEWAYNDCTITTALFPDEIGRPLTNRAIRLLEAARPAAIQIVDSDEVLNAEWSPGVATIRLNPDRYSIASIAHAFDVPIASKGFVPSKIEGELLDFFETGTEGVLWMLQDDYYVGREALHLIEEGDHLTIYDALGGVSWKGVIQCDRKTGWRKYPLNPQYGQQCALGQWVHWIQRGFKPDEWARYFIRKEYGRLRGILVKRALGSAKPGK